jgi:hypothetical protein
MFAANDWKTFQSCFNPFDNQRRIVKKKAMPAEPCNAIEIKVPRRDFFLSTKHCIGEKKWKLEQQIKHEKMDKKNLHLKKIGATFFFKAI